jgi:hypothetical protein
MDLSSQLIITLSSLVVAVISLPLKNRELGAIFIDQGKT